MASEDSSSSNQSSSVYSRLGDESSLLSPRGRPATSVEPVQYNKEITSEGSQWEAQQKKVIINTSFI